MASFRVYPPLAEAMEKLARYIILTFLPHERMTCVPDECKVIDQSKDG